MIGLFYFEFFAIYIPLIMNNKNIDMFHVNYGKGMPA